MIDKVKGVVIEPNGIAHSFGKCRMTLDISDDETHDPIYDIDEFYEQLGISFENTKGKSR